MTRRIDWRRRTPAHPTDLADRVAVRCLHNPPRPPHLPFLCDLNVICSKDKAPAQRPQLHFLGLWVLVTAETLVGILL